MLCRPPGRDFGIEEPAQAELEKSLRAAEVTDHTQYRRRARLNETFHLTIAAAAGSPQLAALIGEFRKFFLNPRWLSRQGAVEGKQALRDHRAIVDALRRGDPEQAELARRRHLKRSYSTLIGAN